MLFERYEERLKAITEVLIRYGIESIDDALELCSKSEINVDEIINGIQPFACNDARYAFKIAIGIIVKIEAKTIQSLCQCVGQVLQAFCIEGSISAKRQIGLGHAKLVSLLLDDRTDSFAFVAGHESFAAAEGAFAIITAANAYRKKELKVLLLGLGKAAADIIARYKGFNYIKTDYNFKSGLLKVLDEVKYSKNIQVKCYGVNSVDEGVAVLWHEQIELIMTGNSTNHVKFTDPTVAIYKKERRSKDLPVFSIASGGGTGRTMHPDNVQAGPVSYGMTDVLGRTHSDLQFAGSSSVPAHVQMVGFIGIGNNPLVGLSVAVVGKLLKGNG